MNYDVRQEAALKIVGIATRTANSRSHEMGALWEKFYKTGVAEQIPARLDGAIYSVYSEYESDFNGPFTVLIGCAVPEGVPASPGLSQKTIHAASYAVFEVVGELPKSVATAWTAIWKTPLDRLYDTDFERYAKDGAVTVHVGIR